MAEMSPEVLKNHVLALQAPLSADELDRISWLARAKRAAMLDLPAPVRPGLWGKFKALLLKMYSAWLDRKSFTAAIADQAHRICVLEDLLQANKIAVPGGRSDA